ncbi:MAG: N-acetyltransferase [Planctomycetota bacterium]|nr:N-acetyltransferase [Planctomycetota bacterium]MDG2142725.1 N-acetyltransferase [Planctomycetota bacterium]
MQSALRFLTREESPSDFETVFAIHSAAFDSDTESKLVDAVRAQASPVVSLVAIEGEGRDTGEVIGHILASPVTIEHGPKDLAYMALGPMAVRPDFQRQGVGARLVLNALDACRELGAAAVFVRDHPDYYPRLGFEPVANLGLYFADPDTERPFFALELQANALTDCAGEVYYHPKFNRS